MSRLHDDVITMLKNQKINIRFWNSYGYTPLYWTYSIWCDGKKIDIINLLVETNEKKDFEIFNSEGIKMFAERTKEQSKFKSSTIDPNEKKLELLLKSKAPDKKFELYRFKFEQDFHFETSIIF